MTPVGGGFRELIERAVRELMDACLVRGSKCTGEGGRAGGEKTDGGREREEGGGRVGGKCTGGEGGRR